MVGKLYEALGLDKDATPEDVQRAYRRAAKKAHPDAGGSPEQFALVALARDCLSDAGRKARYDATGDEGETKIDDTFEQALQMALAAVNKAVSYVLQQGRLPASVDLVARARSYVRDEIKRAEDMIAQQKKNAKDLRKIAKRFKAKKGKTNRLGPMFEANARMEDEAVEKNTHVLGVHKKAYDILNDHEFDIEQMSYDERYAAQRNMAAQSFGSTGVF